MYIAIRAEPILLGLGGGEKIKTMMGLLDRYVNVRVYMSGDVRTCA